MFDSPPVVLVKLRLMMRAIRMDHQLTSETAKDFRLNRKNHNGKNRTITELFICTFI